MPAGSVEGNYSLFFFFFLDQIQSEILHQDQITSTDSGEVYLPESAEMKTLQSVLVSFHAIDQIRLCAGK